MITEIITQFPSPRGVELHKPYHNLSRSRLTNPYRFRPLAGLSCINLVVDAIKNQISELECFRPLAGLSCINL